jgi:hypothetical protein
MKQEIRERRVFMVQEYERSLSEKQAIQATAEEFQVNPDTLYVDWSRRGSWLKEIINFKDSPNLVRGAIIEIHRIMQKVEELAKNSDNDNCKLGAYKLQINSIFKIIDLYRSYDNEELRERIEKFEQTIGKGVIIP